MIVPRFAASVAALAGWRRWSLAVALGALACFAMPPWNALPAAPVGLVGFVWLLDGARRKRDAAVTGFLWGLGYFAVGCVWIVEAFYVPPADFAALGPPIVGGLAALLATFVAGAALAARVVSQRWPALGLGWRRILVLAVCWTAFEWLRGHVATGFPWNPLGHVWAWSTWMLQPASVFGVWGLSTLTFLAFALPATLGDRPSPDGPGGGSLAAQRWRWLLPTAAAVDLLLAQAAFGWWRTPPAEARAETATVVRIVQPNVPQAEKWRPETRARQIRLLVELSLSPGHDRVSHVIWPETATPFLLEQSHEARVFAATAAPANGYLLVGAPRGPSDGAERAAAGARPIWNSLHAIDRNGAIRATYDKAHLVPLGEYIPFRDWIPLEDTIGRGSFEAGPGPRTLHLPGLPAAAVSICYEIIFPAAVVARGPRPRWILNVTNDSWFGVSSGPHQHLTSARLRAIEEGLPLARSANTGVSAMIDGYGRILASLAMERRGVIDAALPEPAPPTPYGRWGDAMPLLLMLLILSASMMRTRRVSAA